MIYQNVEDDVKWHDQWPNNTIDGNCQECVGERSVRMKMASRRLLGQQDKNLALNYLVLSETVRKKTRIKTRRRLKTSRKGIQVAKLSWLTTKRLGIDFFNSQLPITQTING